LPFTQTKHPTKKFTLQEQIKAFLCDLPKVNLPVPQVA